MASPASFQSFDPSYQDGNTPPSPIMQQLRKDYRLFAIAMFVNLFKVHIGLEFNTEDLELDLEGSRPNCCVPTLLGRLLNTLANDRNVNSSNWQIALRRQYTRRMPDANPFFEWVKSDVVLPTGVDNAVEGGEVPAVEVAVAPPKVEGSDVKIEGEIKDETMPASTAPLASTSTLQPPTDSLITSSEVLTSETTSIPALENSLALESSNPPHSTVAEDEKLAAEMLRELAATGTDQKVEIATEIAPGGSDEEIIQWVEKEVSWEEVDLETKIEAIYRVCEWHMTESERFRRLLKSDEDIGWRIDPFGRDALGNTYFYSFDDQRIWMKRPPPPDPNKRPPTLKVKMPVAPSTSTVSHKKKLPASTSSSRAPPVDTSRAPPKDRSASSLQRTSSVKKSRKRMYSDEVEDSSSSSASTSRSLRPVAVAPAKKKLRGSGLRGSRAEVWEEVPEDLLWDAEEPSAVEAAEVLMSGGASGQREISEGAASSGLSEVSDLKTEESEAPANGILPSSPKVEEPEVVEEDVEMKEEILEEAELAELEEFYVEPKMRWEIKYEEERKRCDETEGFVEWEAVCITVDEWRDFIERFSKTKNSHERQMRELVASELLPYVIEHAESKEAARIADIALMNRKRSSRIAIKESAQDEDARLSLERSETSSRLSRASRHKVVPQSTGAVFIEESPVPLAVAASESREERSKKREEEKIAKILAAEQAAIEEVRLAEREAAIAANGGVVPPGMETPEELEAMRIAEEKEAKKNAKENVKLAKEALKKKQKQERTAAKKKANKELAAQIAAEMALLPLETEEPWFLDCEICQKAGWNQDDGSEVISCDRCEDWQHLMCHVNADAQAGRPSVDYNAIDFFCSRCRADPTRLPRPKPPPPALPPAPLPVEAIPKPMEPILVKEKRKYKPRAQKLGEDGLPLPPAKKQKKAPIQGQPNQLPSKLPSSYPQPAAGPSHSNGAQQQSAPSATQSTLPRPRIPGANDPPLDYPSLVALIRANPILVNDLPENYQQHFAVLLNIPVPYPAFVPEVSQQVVQQIPQDYTVPPAPTPLAPTHQPQAISPTPQSNVAASIPPTDLTVVEAIESPHVPNGDIPKEEATTAMEVDLAPLIEIDPALAHDLPQNKTSEPELKEESLLNLIDPIVVPIVDPVVQPVVETNGEVLVATFETKEVVAERLEQEKDLAVAAPEATASTEAPALE